jgi:hypothetical protein
VKKSLLITLFTLACLVIFPPAQSYSQTAEKEKAATPPLGKQDVKDLREAAEGIREVFGIEKPVSTEKPNPGTADSKTAKPEEKRKTVADVADKAVDMVDRLVTQAAGSIQKVAPDVWRIMIRQQYAKAISGISTPLLLIIVTIICFRVMKKWWHIDYKSKDYEDIDKTWHFIITQLVPFAACLILGIWLSVAITASVAYLINPEYYAVRDMLMMILNKGQVN